MTRTGCVIFSFICMFAVCAAEAAEKSMPPHPSVVKRQSAVPREFIFTLFAGKTEQELRSFLSTWGVESVRALNGRLYLVRLGRDAAIDELRSAARGSLVVERIQPNYRYGTGPVKEPVR